MNTTTTLTMTNSNSTQLASLRLWQLISPALPVGAYAYSQGLEYACESGWVRDEAGARQWIHGLLHNNLSHLDVPVLARLHNAWQQQDLGTARQWNGFLLAARESAELRNEDIHLGRALQQLLSELESDASDLWPTDTLSSFANMFALASALWNISLEDCAMGYLWAWTENQVAAAIKLIPLGQVAGQRILSSAMEIIPNLMDSGLSLRDEDIGALSPGLAIASALHETQYTRLFRS